MSRSAFVNDGFPAFLVLLVLLLAISLVAVIRLPRWAGSPSDDDTQDETGHPAPSRARPARPGTRPPGTQAAAPSGPSVLARATGQSGEPDYPAARWAHRRGSHHDDLVVMPDCRPQRLGHTGPRGSPEPAGHVGLDLGADLLSTMQADAQVCADPDCASQAASVGVTGSRPTLMRSCCWMVPAGNIGPRKTGPGPVTGQARISARPVGNER
jgi:hypothetical protein